MGINISAIEGVDPRRIDYMVEQCFDGDHLKIMDADFYRGFSQEELSAFCVKQALYCLPTVELLNTLNTIIMGVSPSRNAIEIGAGNGAIGRGLGITSTDSYMQLRPEIKSHYEMLRQPVIHYGQNVQNIDANKAVSTLRPDVVVGAWVTHLYNPAEHARGGNQFGIDEQAILDQVKTYIVVGNHTVHGQKPILDKVTDVITGDFLFSRSLKGRGQDVIYVWQSSDLHTGVRT